MLGSPGTNHFHGCHHVGGHDRVHLRPELVFQRRFHPVGACPGCSPIRPCLAPAGYFFWFFELAATPFIRHVCSAIPTACYFSSPLVIRSLSLPPLAVRCDPPACTAQSASSNSSVSANSTVVVLLLYPLAWAVQAATCKTRWEVCVPRACPAMPASKKKRCLWRAVDVAHGDLRVDRRCGGHARRYAVLRAVQALALCLARRLTSAACVFRVPWPEVSMRLDLLMSCQCLCIVGNACCNEKRDG